MTDFSLQSASQPGKLALLPDEAGLGYELDDRSGDCELSVRDLHRAADLSSWYWMARAAFLLAGVCDLVMCPDATKTPMMQRLIDGTHRSFFSKPARTAADASCLAVEENGYEGRRGGGIRAKLGALKHDNRAASTQLFGAMISALEEVVSNHYAR